MPVLRPDLLASLALHGLLVFFIIFWKPGLSQTDPLDTSLPIEVITLDEFTRLIEDTARPEPNKPVDEPTADAKPAAHERAAPEAAPAPSDAMAALNDAKAAKPEKADPVDNAPRFKVAAPAPMVRPVMKPKPLLDIGSVQALLNKTPDAPNAQTTAQVQQDADVAPRLTLSEIDAFRAQMQRCWSPPSGARDAEDLRILVRLSLTPTGAISAGPVVVNRVRLGDPFFRAAAESVLRAIRRCQPFTMPVEKYASWRNIELTFDPSRMLGG